MRNLEIVPFKDKKGKSLGIVRISSSNKEWGSVMVKEKSVTLNNGALFTQERTGFFRATLEQIAALKLSEGMNLNKALVGLGLPAHKIAVLETTEPQYEGHSAKINPDTKKVIVGADGGSIYYNTILATEDVADVKIPTVSSAVTATAEVEGLAK